VPAVVLVTEKFWSQGDAVASFVGLPELPRVMLPHPVAGLSRDEMHRVADAVVDRIVDALRG
jgi:hypothetical protein